MTGLDTDTGRQAENSACFLFWQKITQKHVDNMENPAYNRIINKHITFIQEENLCIASSKEIAL